MGLFGKSKAELFAWQNIISPNTPKLVWTEKQLEQFSKTRIENSLKIIQESISLCNTTKKPSVFFKRYDLIIEHMETLAKLEKYVRFRGDKPSKKLAEFQNLRYSEIDKMIDRAWEETLEKIGCLKTEGAKLKKITAFRDEMDKFSDSMSDANIGKYEALCEDFKL